MSIFIQKFLFWWFRYMVFTVILKRIDDEIVQNLSFVRKLHRVDCVFAILGL